MPKKIWSAEKVISDIKSLEKSGADLRHGSVLEDEKKLVSAAIRYFGSWKSAVEAAGIDYTQLRENSEQRRIQKIGKWNEERILEEIRTLKDTEEDLRAVTIKNKYPALFSAAVSPRYFGNWRAALTAAGIDYDNVLAKSPRGRPKRTDIWHTELILEMIRDMAVKGQPMDQESVSSKHPRLLRLATSRFGSWQAAVEMAEGEIAD